ncbi:hypothetical protein [Paraburkholderia sp. MM6662-R1]|uniref:hypothetical protein n=1 Tax=Paraburkholderia sp. MM6662-R1 TaxID=2991066 RepID=UPI003D24F27F
MKHFRAGILEPRQGDRDHVLAEDTVLADRTVAFVGQLAVAAYAKLDAVPVRAAYVRAKDTIALFEARDGALVKIRLAAPERFCVRERLDFGEANDVVKW